MSSDHSYMTNITITMFCLMTSQSHFFTYIQILSYVDSLGGHPLVSKVFLNIPHNNTTIPESSQNKLFTVLFFSVESNEEIVSESSCCIMH